MFRLAILSALVLVAPASAGPDPVLERVTTRAPFPRGLALVDGALYVLCRGRVRGAGGVSASVDDQAGTIYRVDPTIAGPATGDLPDRVRTNGTVFARPTSPPFKLWKRDASPPEADRMTDRPYCALRWHAPTRSFYLCAFSGVDKRYRKGKPSFSKNLTDAILRYDLRTKRWYVVERHDHEAGGTYPHHDPAHHPAPHGWLNGPDNCLPLGRWLYAVAKDNSCLVRYDLKALQADPEAGPPPSKRLLGTTFPVEGHGTMTCYGHSALAARDGWLYVAFRTSSVIARFRLGADGDLARPLRAQLVARFQPYDPRTLKSANITDICFDARGRLYVVNAVPARVHRFTPGGRVYDGRTTRPWLDLAQRTDNPRMKIENLLAHGPWLYVASGDGYAFQKGAWGTVYRARLD